MGWIVQTRTEGTGECFGRSVRRQLSVVRLYFGLAIMEKD